jgi:hypothetical protein
MTQTHSQLNAPCLTNPPALQAGSERAASIASTVVPAALTLVIRAGLACETLLRFSVAAAIRPGWVQLATPVGLMQFPLPQPGGPVLEAFEQARMQYGSQASLRAVHQALTEAALGDCGTWIRLTKVSPGTTERSARVRMAVRWHQRIEGQVVGGRTQFHTVLVPRASLRVVGEDTWLPVSIAHTAIRDRLGLGSDFALMDGRWLAEDALWHEVFEPAVARARKFCERNGIELEGELISGDTVPAPGCAASLHRARRYAGTHRTASRARRVKTTKGV